MFPRAISGRLKKLAIASALLAFAVASGFAETTVKVPFDFLANGRHCSAGAYTVNLDAQFNMVKLQSAGGARTFQWVILSGAPSPNDTRDPHVRPGGKRLRAAHHPVSQQDYRQARQEHSGVRANADHHGSVTYPPLHPQKVYSTSAIARTVTMKLSTRIVAILIF